MPKNKSVKATSASDKKIGSKSKIQSLKTKIEDYRRSELLQPTEKNYSNTIEFYDFMPKFVFGKRDHISGQFSEIEVVAQEDTLRITPLIKESKKANRQEQLREEII